MREVMLVHGAPGNAAGWGPMAELLAASARVSALNLRDVGRDEPDVTLEDIIADVAARIAAARAPVVLVGHSFGAWVAGQAAARAPERVERLFLMEGISAVTPPMAEGFLGLAGVLESGQFGLDALVGMAAPNWLDPDRPDPKLLDAIRALFVAEPPPRIARALRRGAGAVAHVPAAGIPARVLCCEGDRAAPVAFSRELATRLGAELSVIPGANHFPHWYDPADIAQRILA